MIIRKIPKMRNIETIIKYCGNFSTIFFEGIDTTEYMRTKPIII
jgi:hypothetical protein